MSDETHTTLAPLQSAEITGSTNFCLSDEQVAEYFDGVLPDADRNRVEHHIADCRFCAARIGMLGRLEASSGEARIPEESLATAKLMRQTPRGGNRRLVAWAAAAVLVLVAGIQYQSSENRATESNLEPPGVPAIAPRDIRQTRNIETSAFGPTITSPREGQFASARSQISWTAVPNSLYYQVRIVSDEGDLLWQERVDGTAWRMPERLGLSPGAEYFVRIDAYLTEGQSLQSDYRLFRFGGGG
jgi:hypothetical protein